MFSDKNYGLPKELIEAAKRVHEKQLEEGAGKYAEPRVDPEIHKQKNTEVKKILHSLAAREKKEMNRKLPGFKKTQAEEVQFTEEELAEAFAIFLEENFHVEMLTKEDIDYVFENEFYNQLDERTWGQYLRGVSREQAAVENDFKGIGTPVQKKGGLLGKQGLFPRSSQKSPQKSPQKPKIDMSGMPGSLDDDGSMNTRPPAGSLFPGEDAQIKRTKAEVKKSSTPVSTTSSTPVSTTSSTPVSTTSSTPPSFGAQLRKVGGNAPANSDTAGGRAKSRLLDARARARTAAKDAVVRKTGRGQLSWAKKAFEPSGN